ncbi:putative sulfate exporter family transporter [Mesorhizobium sp. CAU 1741]|uniref:YeiH family protein n=1 Tax=Mesorhizobium sp. CAU 1741 TaxID=3140366 RepID=UPI00325B8A76
MTGPEPLPERFQAQSSQIFAWIALHKRGVVLAATIALAASFLSEHYGAPAMLFALLIGMAFNFMTENPGTAPGVELCSKTILRIGVALLGLRLTFADVSQLGLSSILGVCALTLLVLASGTLIARLTGRPMAFGLLTGGAVAICGASAALAIAAVIPKRHLREEDVLFTVVGVTALSTAAMILYPILFAALGLSELASGYLIGATIHDVAQVVGAGYSISDPAGEIATFTKLLRVALLPVVLVAVGLCYRREAGGGVSMPWFVVAFMALMLLRNLLPLNEAILDILNEASRFMLLTAIAALGVKTSLARIFAAGSGGMLILGAETIFLLGLALAFVYLNFA